MKYLSLKTIKTKLHNNLNLLVFELFYKAAFYITAVILFQWGLKLTLRFSSFSYITIENITAYLRSPITIICIIFYIFIMGIFLLIELNALIAFFYRAVNIRDINIQQIMFPGIISVKMLLQKKVNIFIMPFYAVVESVFLSLPLIIILLSRFRTLKNVVIAVVSRTYLLQIICPIVFLIIVAGILSIFVLQYCSLENKGIKESFILSTKLLKKHFIKLIKTLLIKNIILIISFYVIHYAVLALSGIIIYILVDEKVMFSAYLGVYDKLNVFFVIIFTTIGMLGNLHSITRIFVVILDNEGEKPGYEIDKIQEEISNEMEIPIIYVENKKRILYPTKNRMIISIVFAAIAIFCITYIFNWIKNGTFTSQHAMLKTNVTAHRGSSKDAPENTIASIEQAIADYADYAEIDVTQTKDGVVVLMHDDNVRRTTNGTGYIWSYTYFDLIQLDAGSWFTKDFTDVRVPTLAEVLETAKGRIYLNIEIKKNSHNEDIVEKVVKLIEEYYFEQQCVVTSTHYASLARIKEINPNIRTGYIMALAYGNFYDNEYADFFSIKSGFINENLVKLAHSLGKEVHAWTVNDKTEMERMKSLGVDNIITDYPILAKEVVYSEENESLRSFLGLFINR